MMPCSISYGYVFVPSKCDIMASKGKMTPCITMYGEKVRKILSFKLGVPSNDKGANMAELWVVKTTSLLSAVVCNGTGFSPTVNK